LIALPTRSSTAIRQRALALELRTPRQRAEVCRFQQAARRLSVERGALGVTNVLVQSAAPCDAREAGTALFKLERKGELVGAKVDGAPKHWFANDELRQRWLANMPKARRSVALAPAVAARQPVEVRMATPAQLALMAAQPATTPGHVRLQVIPSPRFDVRYQCDPAQRYDGAGFAQLGIGRYLPDVAGSGAAP
jgi:hypothetical protein